MSDGSRPKNTAAERLAVVETGIAELCKKVAEFEDRMEDSLKELKGEIKELNRLYNEAAKQKAAETPTLELLGTQVGDHEKRVRDLEKLYPAIRLFIWVGAIFGASIIALIWALIIGQASLTFTR